ncbi:MAG: hypothetical protein V1857_06965 [archaeon]
MKLRQKGETAKETDLGLCSAIQWSGAGGTASSIDFEDGSPTVTCLLLDPRTTNTGNNRINFSFRLVQTA